MKNFKIMRNIYAVLMIINLILFLLKIINLESAQVIFFLFSGIYALIWGLNLIKQVKKREGLLVIVGGIFSLFIFIYVVYTLIFNKYS